MWLVLCLILVNIAGTFEESVFKKNITRFALPFVINDEWNLKRTPKQIETVLNTINDTVIGEEYVLHKLSDVLEKLKHLLTRHRKGYNNSKSKLDVSSKENDRRYLRTDDENKMNKIRRPLPNLNFSDLKKSAAKELNQSENNIILMKLYELHLLPLETNLGKQQQCSKNITTSFETLSNKIDLNVTKINSSEIFSVFNRPHLEYKQMPFEEVFRSSLEMPLVLDKVRKGLAENKPKISSPTVEKKVTKSSELIKLFTPKGRFLRSLNGTVDLDSIVQRIKNKYPMLKPYLLKQYAKLLTNTEPMELNHGNFHQHELHLLDETAVKSELKPNNSKSEHQNDKNFYEIYFEEEDDKSKHDVRNSGVINKEPRKTDSIPLEFQEYTYRPPLNRQNVFAPKYNFPNKGLRVCKTSTNLSNSLIRPRLQHTRFYNIKKLSKLHKLNEIPQRKSAPNIVKIEKEVKSLKQHDTPLSNNTRENQTKLKDDLIKEDPSYLQHYTNSHEKNVVLPLTETTTVNFKKENNSNRQLIIPISKPVYENKTEQFQEVFKKDNNSDTQYGILPIRVIEDYDTVLNNDTHEHSKLRNHPTIKYKSASNGHQSLDNDFNKDKLNQQSEVLQNNRTYEYSTFRSQVILNKSTERYNLSSSYDKKEDKLTGQLEISKKCDTKELLPNKNSFQENKIIVKHKSTQTNCTNKSFKNNLKTPNDILKIKGTVEQVIIGNEFTNENVSYEELDTTLYRQHEKQPSKSTDENSSIEEEIKGNNESSRYNTPINKDAYETSTSKNNSDANDKSNQQYETPKNKTEVEHTTLRKDCKNVFHDEHKVKSYEKYGIPSTGLHEHQEFKNDLKDKSESQRLNDILETKSSYEHPQHENYLKGEGKLNVPHEIAPCMCTHEKTTKNQFRNQDIWYKYQETMSHEPHEINLSRGLSESSSKIAKIDLNSEENRQMIPPSWGAYRRLTETFSNDHYHGNNETSGQPKIPGHQSTSKKSVPGFIRQNDRKSNTQYKSSKRKGFYEYPASTPKFGNGEDEPHGHHELHPIYDIRKQSFETHRNTNDKLYESQAMSTFEHQPKVASKYKNLLNLLTTERPKDLLKSIDDIDADDESYYEQLQDIPQKMSTHEPYATQASNYFKREYISQKQGAIPTPKEIYEHRKETLIHNLTGDYNMDIHEQQNEKPPIEHPNSIISGMNPLREADKIYLRKRQTQPKSHQIYRSHYRRRTMPQTKIALKITSEMERKHPKTKFIENSAIEVQKAYEIYDGVNSIIRNDDKTYQQSKRSSVLKDFEVQFIDDLDDSDSDPTDIFYIDTTYIDSSDESPEQAGYLDNYETTPAVKVFRDGNKEVTMNLSHSSRNADEPKANKENDDFNILNDNQNLYLKNNHKRQHDIFENIEYEELLPDEFIQNDDESNLRKFIEEFVLWKTVNMLVNDYQTEERHELNIQNQHPIDRFFAKDDNKILNADEFHGDHKVISNRVPEYPNGANPFKFRKHEQPRRKNLNNIAQYVNGFQFDDNQDEEEKEHIVINNFGENIINNDIPDINEYSIHKRNKVSFSPYQDHYPLKYIQPKPAKSKSIKHFIANETVGKQKGNFNLFNQSSEKKHTENRKTDRNAYDSMKKKDDIKVNSHQNLRVSYMTKAAENMTKVRKHEEMLKLKQNVSKGNSWQDIVISLQPLDTGENVSTSTIKDEDSDYQEIEKPVSDEVTTLAPEINNLNRVTPSEQSYRIARTTTQRISTRRPSVTITTKSFNNFVYRLEKNNIYKPPEELPITMKKDLHGNDLLEKYGDFRTILTEQPKEIETTEDSNIDNNVRRKKFLNRKYNQKSLLHKAKHNNTLSLWNKTRFKPLNESGIPHFKVSVFDKTRRRRSAASSNARKWVRKRNRLLCIVMKKVEQRHLVPHVQNTWGNRCNVLVFVTVAQGAIYEEDVWPYTRSVLKYIRKRHHNHAEWFLKTDIDSFVAIGNLKYNFLKYYSPKTPLFFGCSGAFDYKAFILSKKALSRLNSLGAKTKHCTKVQLDVGIGPCLDFLNIYGIYSSECDRGTKTVEQFLADADPQVVQPSGEEWALPQFHHNKIFLQHVSIGDMYLIDYHLHAMYHIFETKTAKTVMVRPRVAVPSFSEEGLVS